MAEKRIHQSAISVDVMRHSCAHLLAAAVQALWPDVKLGVGPVIEHGLYYDFDLPHRLIDEDFPKIEAKMREIAAQAYDYEREEVSLSEAKKRLIAMNQPYKVELVKMIERTGSTNLVGDEKVTPLRQGFAGQESQDSEDKPTTVSFYTTGNFIDLCRGGHVANTKDIGPFKLLSVAGAYWRGSEKNPQLQRIYATCWSTQAELDSYLQRLEDAKARDHKKLGRELDLFVFSETVGRGLPLFTPKGATLRRILERFIVDEELKRGYQHVSTPDLANLALYKKSGHYPYYQDSMYPPLIMDDEQFMLRPMSCPHHFELYLSRPHSYRELPIRFAELAKLYRYEKSGELMGLQRVRSFCLADAHIIARERQAASEVAAALDLIEDMAELFDLKAGEDYWYRLSLGSRLNEKKYFKDDASWDAAETCLRSVLTERKAHFMEAPDEAAFYGPKIDIQMRNVNGKEDTAFTVQYDFVMPKRFALSYTGETGDQEEPIVIHRSSIGAIERVIAFLIEHYAGKFPLWLAPVQVKILPIADRHEEYARHVAEHLKDFRVEIDQTNDTVGKKIRSAQLEQVPYMLVVGDKELEQGTVAVRSRDGGDQETLAIPAFGEKLARHLTERLPGAKR